MKVVFFTAFGALQGTYFRWQNLAIGLQRLGCDVSVLSVETGRAECREESHEGVPYHVVPVAGGQRLFGLHAHPWNVMRRCWHGVADADVFHAFQPFPVTCFPALIRGGKARKVVWDWDDLWHGGIIQPGADARAGFAQRVVNASMRQLEQRMPGWADAVTTCSGYLDRLSRERGATCTKVLHNGFWSDPQALSREAARARFGMKPDVYYFGFMGRTIRELDWCYDVLRLSQARGSQVRLALCGMTEEALAGLPEELRARMDFFGFLNKADVAAFARAIDCGLLPLELNAFNESRFPIKFAEYLQGGARVICSTVGEVALLAPHFEHVTLAGTIREEWQGSIRHHLSNDGPGMKDSSQALGSYLDWGTISAELLGFYQQCLGE